MKHIARLAACLLALAAALGLASCAAKGEETPNGMMIASCAGADYRLYVPNTWVLNTSYGVSGAYRDLARQSTVSVNSYPITEELRAEMDAALAGEDSSGDTSPRIGWFAEHYCQEPVRTRALDNRLTFDEEGCIPTTLDGVNARQYCYSGLVDGETLYFLQIVAERENAEGKSTFYVFTFTANAEMYEMYMPDVELMLDQFIFAEPYVPYDYAKQLDDGADAPAGMKAAFGDDVAYCLYVPESWEIRMDDQIYGARVAADGTSVSVVPYMPTDVEQISVQEYFDLSRELMEDMAGEGGFELLSDTGKVELGGRQATVYEFRLRLGGTTYRYRQYIAAYKSMIYCLTYTALDSAYDAHLAELDAIVGAFAFR